MKENRPDGWPIGSSIHNVILDEYGNRFAIVADDVLPEDTIVNLRVCDVVEEFLDTEAEPRNQVPGSGFRTESEARFDLTLKSVADENEDWTVDAIRTACVRNYDEDGNRTEEFVADLQQIEARIEEMIS